MSTQRPATKCKDQRGGERETHTKSDHSSSPPSSSGRNDSSSSSSRATRVFVVLASSFLLIALVIGVFVVGGAMDSVMRFFHGEDKPKDATTAASSFYDLKAKDIDGNDFAFEKLRGKVALIVNVASECGRTRTNYEQLQPLYEELHDRGLEVLAFPCNQFLFQEPGTEEQIKEKICGKWRATFTVMERIKVNGPETHPVYTFLKAATDGRPINWNFEKFLCSRRGVCARFDGKNPNDMRADILRLLDESADPSPSL